MNWKVASTRATVGGVSVVSVVVAIICDNSFTARQEAA